MAIPTDLREVADVFHFGQWARWRTVILPGIFPYLVTGMVTASGGAWNASIVAEYFHFKGKTLQTIGLGAQISSATDSGNFDLLLLSTIVMAALVVCVNRSVWRPENFAEIASSSGPTSFSESDIIPVTILSNRGTSPGVNGRRRTRAGSGASSRSARLTLIGIIGIAFMEQLYGAGEAVSAAAQISNRQTPPRECPHRRLRPHGSSRGGS